MASIAAAMRQDYNREGIRASVERLFTLLELERIVRPGMQVVIKPNLLMKRKPEEATTTHPAVVEAVAGCLKDLGAARITIADSPGGQYTRGALEEIYSVTGMKAAAESAGATLNFDTGFTPVPYGEGVKCKEFNIINPVAEADLVINLAKLKTHCMTALSGGVKNLFGTIPGLQKPELHFRFPEADDFAGMLLDLSRTIAPAVTLVDAVVAMEGDGPSSGTPRTCGFLAAATDIYGLDRWLCHIINMPYETVPMMREAVKRGWAPADAGLLEVTGDRVEVIGDFQPPASRDLDFTAWLPSFLRRPVRYIEKKMLSPRPVILRRKCIGCGRCAESCPAKTITVSQGKAAIGYGRCIKCYCCHEMCPVRAIEVKKSRLLRL